MGVIDFSHSQNGSGMVSQSQVHMYECVYIVITCYKKVMAYFIYVTYIHVHTQYYVHHKSISVPIIKYDST